MREQKKKRRNVSVAGLLATLACSGLTVACGAGAPPDDNLLNGLKCDPTGLPSQDVPIALIGQLRNESYVDIQENNTYELQFGHQGGQHLNVWARLYAPEGYSWILDAQLLDPTTREHLGARQRRTGVCQDAWVDADVRLFVDLASTEGPCVMSVRGELYDRDDKLITTLSQEHDIVVTQVE